MQKALEQMNLKLTEIFSDITGVTGRSIIRAILKCAVSCAAFSSDGGRFATGSSGQTAWLCRTPVARQAGRAH
jgi:hypothetical protein